jgi:signal transduction histidine kinase
VQIPRQSRPNSAGRFFRDFASSMVLVVLLGAILITLAVLQYRWSGQVSDAEHERMEASLSTAMNQFRIQFQNELQRLDMVFQPDTTTLNHQDWHSYAAHCENVLSLLGIPLVRHVWLWVAGTNSAPQLLQLNRKTVNFEVAPWPSDFEPIRLRYHAYFLKPFPASRGFRPFDRFINFEIPLILHPLVGFQNSPNRSSQDFLGFLLLQLDRSVIGKELLPEIGKRSFGDPKDAVYRVAVIGGRNAADFVYCSDPDSEMELAANPDARVILFETPREGFPPAGPPPRRGGSPLADPFLRPEGRTGRGARLSLLPAGGENGRGWELIAKHREGSLDAAVMRSRKRNLAVSFGSLLLLAASMALLLVFVRRSQRLAKLQIDFVAGVSHELRTPLAVICSAGDNLADGVVGDSATSAKKYGELIRSEGRKLTGMIDQILQFASVRSGRRQHNLIPGHINDIALKALEREKSAIDAAGFDVETSFDPDLPMINVDAAILSQAIQNLIQNALKYSGEHRWIMVRTEESRTKRGIEVRLSVEDKGMGIDSGDLNQIFEPFYRGRAASEAQIHGTGLGLFMAREAILSMGGRITVRSIRGRGSTFTIHFPECQNLNQH